MIRDIENILVEGNLRFQWKLIQDMENIDIGGKIPKYPVLILTCMDPRIDVHRIFQLNPGDVFVLRNAGNIITTDVSRSILIAIHEYNIKYIIVLGHIDCGMTKIRLNELREKLPTSSRAYVKEFFMPFKDEFNNINDQIEKLIDFKAFPPGVEVTSMIYDIENGWVLEYDMIKNIESVKELKQKYRDLLTKKRYQLIDFLESIEEEIIGYDNLVEEKKKVNLEVLKKEVEKKEIDVFKTSYEEKTEPINLINQLDQKKQTNIIHFNRIKVHIPKIHFPKIKVIIPKFYSREREK